MNANDKLIHQTRLMFHALIYSGSVARREWQDEDGQWLQLVKPQPKGANFDVVIDNRTFELFWNQLYWEEQRRDVRRYISHMFLASMPGYCIATCRWRTVSGQWRVVAFLCHILPKDHRYHGYLSIRGVTMWA